MTVFRCFGGICFGRFFRRLIVFFYLFIFVSLLGSFCGFFGFSIRGERDSCLVVGNSRVDFLFSVSFDSGL